MENSRTNRKKSKKTNRDGLSRKGSHESCHSSQEGQHDQWETQTKKWKPDFLCYRGLRNQGATCYLNSVLQTLFMTEEFRKAVVELKLSNGKENCVSKALQNLFHDLEPGQPGSAATNRVTSALEIRNVCEQQDAAEYYQKILSLTGNKAAEIFQGEKKHSTACKYGSHDSVEELNSFFSLAIAMDSDQHLINIKKSFGTLFDSVLMEGEDQLYCETCQIMTDMEMKCTILKWPEVLTLHLQRFNLDYSYMVYRKNNCPVKIPLQLKVQDESGVDYQYDLYAVVNHSGSLSGGHYYADIKSSEDQQWYEFNDSSVHRIDSLRDNRQSKKACLLFFRKCQTKAIKQDACESNIQQDQDAVKGRESGELSVSQTNTNIQNKMNPEHTVPQQDPDHINIENQHPTESTAKAEINSDDETTENQATPSIHSGAAEGNIQSTETHHPDFSRHLIIDKQQPSQRQGIALWINKCNVQYYDNQCAVLC
ncbi:ubiquitin carboxyl-terminal hydrolase 47-like [Danio aesculapii]|uniref:ubiquitin carboxyl-terminal hydrolase 47-like n=1 Tax=Danio aesculapii TaxID=1142201 RepID=UPI0024BFFD34|nr:ubiquitin carboxyl-terminal hydrolase 47-like [Danio aesculapii]XP_056308080.1 ubiquitin carboxyl-terminal hydrolase 47-like [Danio aesculapii]XP_056308081.1 ubiquitin carboxyl-terminal hydrolase 47-like [Danio aesculapii]